MKKVLLSLLCAVALSFRMLYANPVDISTAKQIGENFIKVSTNIGSQRTDIQSSLTYTLTSANGVACIYVFNIAEGGFVVVSAEDRVKPILGYSTEGSFDANDIADGLMFNLNSFQEEIEYVRDHNIALSDDIANEWKSVTSTGRIGERRNDRVVAPLLDITWNQGQYYNNLCPEDPEGPGGRVYAGCVATAMSMVMKYWNYPAQGIGYHSYTPGGSGYPSYPTQYANFGETSYHFELMPDFLDSTSTEEEIFYIAQLQYHCGVSVNMMYSPNGSGSYSEYVPMSMNYYFGYEETMELLYKESYNPDDWSEMLKGELYFYPVYYCGQDDAGQGGHAFVCDGFDENDYFHFNWGWGGRDNGYFAMGALNTTRYAFNSWNGAIQGCFPPIGDYYYRPKTITDMTLTEADDNQSVNITWTNPSQDLTGGALSIDSVIILRNFHEIAFIVNATPGEVMSYTDIVPEDGVYEYSVLVKNDAGYSKPVYQKIMVGPKCDLVFEMNDDGGNGWRGASISVVDESGRRIDVVTMEDGESETRTIPLLQGNLSFIWNPGWFSAVDDHEISFNIYDADNNLIFNSPDSLSKGLLFSYDNNCDGSLNCVRPSNPAGSYIWNDEDHSFGAEITWSLSAPNLVYFNVYRSINNVDYELITVVDKAQSASYTYFDEVEPNTYYYMVKAFYEKDDQSCESEPAMTANGDEYVVVEVTSVDENTIAEAQIFPNPSDGKITVKASGMNQAKVFNIVGQEVESFKTQNDTITIDMSDSENGIYFIQISTNFGIVTKKFVLSR